MNNEKIQVKLNFKIIKETHTFTDEKTKVHDSEVTYSRSEKEGLNWDLSLSAESRTMSGT